MSDDQRVRPPETADEVTTMLGLLDFLRATVVRKASGLTTEQAVSRPVPASTLSVASVVKHLTGVERFWFSIDFAGADLSWPWPEDDPHGGFPIDEGDTIEALVAAYEEECARSRAAVAGVDFDTMSAGDDVEFRLRYGVAHMVEETARHCGHLDLLRESIDGERGE